MKNKKYRALAIMFSLIIGWTLLFFLLNPRGLVDKLGTGNSYLVLFLVSMIGAIASVSYLTTYPALFAFAAGGINPVVLVIVGSAGLILGDILFFLIALGTRNILSEDFVSRTEYFSKKLERKKGIFLSIVIYLYIGFTPLPNNLVTGALAMLNYPFKKLALPLIMGDITMPILISLIGFYGFSLI